MRYGLLFATLTLLALLAGGVQAAEPEGLKPELLKYEDFLQKLGEDKVKSVTIGNWPFSQIEGIYVKGNTERGFFSQRPLQAVNDPLLLELLEKLFLLYPQIFLPLFLITQKLRVGLSF